MLNQNRKTKRIRQKMKKRVSKKHIVEEVKPTVESLMEARFDRLEDKLDSFKDEINTWKQEFVKQLTKLNSNMESVLNTIAEHEARITKLEQDNLKSETRKETVTDLAKFGWIAAKILLIAGALIGSVGGCGWILKFLGY